MKIALIDERGEGIGLALALAQAGHEIVHVSTFAWAGKMGSGLMQKAPNIMAVMPASAGVDIYVVLARGLAVQANVLRRRGARVIGGNAWVERLVSDGAFVAAMAEAWDLRMPRWRNYSEADALALIKRDPRKYILQSRVGRLSSDIPEVLESHIRRSDGEVSIGDYVPGVELYVETWFVDGENKGSFAVLENCRFLDGDMGAEIEPQTAAMWSYSMREPRPYQAITKKMEVLLRQEKYTGPLGARMVISERDKKPYLVSFHSTSFRHVHAARHELGFVLPHLPFSRPISSDFAFTIAVSVPPYPYPSKIGPISGPAVLGTDGLYLHDVERDPHRDHGVQVAGCSGLIGDVVGTAISVEEARRLAVRQLDGICVEGKQARRGGGATRIGRDVLRLAAMGYEVPRRAREEAKNA